MRRLVVGHHQLLFWRLGARRPEGPLDLRYVVLQSVRAAKLAEAIDCGWVCLAVPQPADGIEQNLQIRQARNISWEQMPVVHEVNQSGALHDLGPHVCLDTGCTVDLIRRRDGRRFGVASRLIVGRWVGPLDIGVTGGCQ